MVSAQDFIRDEAPRCSSSSIRVSGCRRRRRRHLFQLAEKINITLYLVFKP
jgi:hypothetical protein